MVALRPHQLSAGAGVYYVALKTVDGGGRTSALSNVAVFATHAEYATAHTAVFTQPPVTQPAQASDGVKQDKDEQSDSLQWLYFVIAALVVLLLAVVVLVVCVCLRRRKPRGKIIMDVSPSDSEVSYTVHASFPSEASVTPLDEVTCDILENVVDKATLSQEPDVIAQIHSTAGVVMEPATSSVKHASGTWPAVKATGPREKRTNIFKTVGKGTFFSDLKKRITGSKPQADDVGPLEPQWTHPTAPVQNIPYSNPLYGQAQTLNEVEVTNSVIEAPYTLTS